MNAGQRVTMVLMVLVIGAAVAYAFLPLPNQTFRGEPATCGPGSSSSSAAYVKLFPQSVISGPVPAGQEDVAKAFENQCQGVADTRLTIVAVVSIATVVIGLLAIAILASNESRRAPPPEHR
jgi:hypothetical protein